MHGIVGIAKNGTIQNCVNNAIIDSKNRDEVQKAVGGVVGYIESGTVEKCRNMANIMSGSNAGGVVGCTLYGNVYECFNRGKVMGVVSIAGGKCIGGLIGVAEIIKSNGVKERYIYDSYNTGAVSGAETIGGLIGCMTNGSTSYTRNI